ncbi:MAG: hypothetical protein Q9172_003328 [Xanthocarpia lactea]
MTTTEEEITYVVPFNNTLKLTITLYLLRPVTFAELRSCLTGAQRLAGSPDEAKYPNPVKNFQHLDPQSALQFGIAGDLLWGINRLLWVDVTEILFGLMQWTNKREKAGERAVEFSLSVWGGDPKEVTNGVRGRGELATGYLTREAEYLDYGKYGRDMRLGYDAFYSLFGIRRVHTL